MIEFILLAIETEEEKDAVEQIFDLYFSRMVSKADGILHNEEDAHDVAMDVIKKIAEKPSEFLEYNSPDVIYKIICMTKNEAIDIYRRNKRRNEHIADTDELESYIDEKSCEDFIVNEETKNLLKESIKELDERSQTIIMMHYARRMKAHEIAEELGIEASYVNVLMCRARKVLKEKLFKKGYVR